MEKTAPTQPGSTTEDGSSEARPRILEAFSPRWEGEYLQVGLCRYTVPGVPHELTWEVIRRTARVSAACNGVEVIALTRGPSASDERKLILIENFRAPVGSLCLEWPAGLMDNEESPEAAALRELREETGYTGVVTRTEPLIFTDPWKSTETSMVVHVDVDLANPANHAAAQSLDENEFIHVLLVPVSRLREELQNRMAGGRCLLSAMLLCFVSGLETAQALRL